MHWRLVAGVAVSPVSFFHPARRIGRWTDVILVSLFIFQPFDFRSLPLPLRNFRSGEEREPALLRNPNWNTLEDMKCLRPFAFVAWGATSVSARSSSAWTTSTQSRSEPVALSRSHRTFMQVHLENVVQGGWAPRRP